MSAILFIALLIGSIVRHEIKRSEAKKKKKKKFVKIFY